MLGSRCTATCAGPERQCYAACRDGLEGSRQPTSQREARPSTRRTILSSPHAFRDTGRVTGTEARAFHPAVILGTAVGALVGGLASAASGALTTTGNVLVTAGATLIASAISWIASEQHGRGTAAVVFLLGLVAAVVGISQFQRPSANPGVIRFVGGCSPFQVFAQNRWAPYGTAVRSAPSILSKQIGAKDPNQSLAVNGWVHGTVAYPRNTPPWNSDVWFHLADGAGWVSFAGTRADPVSRDPTGLADGGPPAQTDPACEGDAQ
jgi:hypothetical protein